MNGKWESGRVRRWEVVNFSPPHFRNRPLSAASWDERRSVK